jgi:hypothetical protein
VSIEALDFGDGNYFKTTHNHAKFCVVTQSCGMFSLQIVDRIHFTSILRVIDCIRIIIMVFIAVLIFLFVFFHSTSHVKVHHGSVLQTLIAKRLNANVVAARCASNTVPSTASSVAASRN